MENHFRNRKKNTPDSDSSDSSDDDTAPMDRSPHLPDTSEVDELEQQQQHAASPSPKRKRQTSIRPHPSLHKLHQLDTLYPQPSTSRATVTTSVVGTSSTTQPPQQHQAVHHPTRPLNLLLSPPRATNNKASIDTTSIIRMPAQPLPLDHQYTRSPLNPPPEQRPAVTDGSSVFLHR